MGRAVHRGEVSKKGQVKYDRICMTVFVAWAWMLRCRRRLMEGGLQHINKSWRC